MNNVEKLIREFIASEEIKTFTNLSKYLNDAGCLTQRGKSWTPANINKYCYENNISIN